MGILISNFMLFIFAGEQISSPIRMYTVCTPTCTSTCRSVYEYPTLGLKSLQPAIHIGYVYLMYV